MHSFDLALSSEAISEAIVDYVESIFPSILNELVIPSIEEFEFNFKIQKLKSKRMKKKNKSNFLKQSESRREFFWYLINLKRKNKKTNVEHGNIPFRFISFSDETSAIDGEEIVNSSSMVIRPNGGLLGNTITQNPPENVQITQFVEINKRKLSDVLEYQSEQKPFVRENEILDKIEFYINDGKPLSFSNLIEIIEVLTFSDKMEVKDRIFNLINTYLKTVKRKDEIDIVDEFNYHNVTLSEISKEIPLEKLETLDDTLLILLKATILYEFRRQCRNAGLNYIDGKMAFEEYDRKIEEYTWNASRMYSQ